MTSEYARDQLMFSLCFTAAGILLIATNFRVAAVFAFIQLYFRCNWVFGNPYLYDLDIVPDYRAWTLMFKTYTIFGGLLLFMIKGKIRKNHESIHIMGHRSLTLGESIRGKKPLQVMQGPPLKTLSRKSIAY